MPNGNMSKLTAVAKTSKKSHFTTCSGLVLLNIMIMATLCIGDIACQFDDDDSDLDGDDYNEDFIPPAPLIFGFSNQYDDGGMESTRSNVLIQSRGMMGMGKGKGGGGGGGGGGMNMTMMMINVTHDDHHYDKDDDDDKGKKTTGNQIRNCNFKMPDKVIGMQKVVYIPRITVFDTEHDADVVSAKGELKKIKMKKKKKKGKKKKKKKCCRR